MPIFQKFCRFLMLTSGRRYAANSLADFFGFYFFNEKTSDPTFLTKKKNVFFYFFNEKTSDLMFLTKKRRFYFFNEKTSEPTFLAKKNVFFYFFNENVGFDVLIKKMMSFMKKRQIRVKINGSAFFLYIDCDK
jgi:hypothetical protein